LSQMQRAIQLGRGPELADNLQSLSAAYSAGIGLYDKSEEFSLNAFRLHKDSSQLFAAKSSEERFKGNYQSALRFANKAYHLDSSNWYYMDEKAWLLSLLGRHREALDTWLLYWNDGSSSGGTQGRIGYSYWVLGNKKKAYEYFNGIIERANAADRRTYLNFYKLYDAAGVYAFLGKKEKAYQHLEEVRKDTFFPFWFISLIKEDPLFEKIRNEDHFKRIVQHMEDINNAERKRVIQWLEKEKMKAKVERY
jgi:tetratricopeptide (TPR) repeat protein